MWAMMMRATTHATMRNPGSAKTKRKNKAPIRLAGSCHMIDIHVMAHWDSFSVALRRPNPSDTRILSRPHPSKRVKAALKKADCKKSCGRFSARTLIKMTLFAFKLDLPAPFGPRSSKYVARPWRPATSAARAAAASLCPELKPAMNRAGCPELKTPNCCAAVAKRKLKAKRPDRPSHCASG